MGKGQERIFTADERALAVQVRARRKEHRFTQEQLADAADVSLGVVSNFERFRTYPQPGNLRAILRVLQMPEPGSGSRGDAGVGTLEVCPTCERVRWPDSYELTFDILGAYMDTLTPAERKAFQRKITKPVHGVE